MDKIRRGQQVSVEPDGFSSGEISEPREEVEIDAQPEQQEVQAEQQEEIHHEEVHEELHEDIEDEHHVDVEELTTSSDEETSKKN